MMKEASFILPTVFRTLGAQVASQRSLTLPVTVTIVGESSREGNLSVSESLISAEAKKEVTIRVKTIEIISSIFSFFDFRKRSRVSSSSRGGTTKMFFETIHNKELRNG